MKKLIALLVVAGVVFSSVGCGSPAATPSSSGKGSGKMDPKPSETPKPSDPVKEVPKDTK